jgi:hypothetical protein
VRDDHSVPTSSRLGLMVVAVEVGVNRGRGGEKYCVKAYHNDDEVAMMDV